MCDSDERNMSHTSISAEDFKPAAGRFGPLQSKTKKIPFVSKYTFFFFFFYTVPIQRILNSQWVSVTIPITLVLFWISFIHNFQEFCE